MLYIDVVGRVICCRSLILNVAMGIQRDVLPYKILRGENTICNLGTPFTCFIPPKCVRGHYN